MSKESYYTLNNDVLVGLVAKRGKAWHFDEAYQGEESNHYDGPIPIEDVRRRIFNWRALSGPVSSTVCLPDGTELTVTDSQRQAIIRPDTKTILGVFKDSYEMHQYDEWLLTEVANILDDELVIGSAGLLEDGGVAFVQVEMPENIYDGESGETFRPFLLACTSLNGKLSTTFKAVMCRVVCDNTCEIALSEKGSQVKIKHSKYSRPKIANVREALGILNKATDDFQAEMRSLIETPVSGKVFISWLDAMNPIPETEGRAKTVAETKRDLLLNLYTNDARVSPWSGTAWGVVQLANTFAQHVAPVNSGTNRLQKNIFATATGKLFDADRSALVTLQSVLSAA